MADDGSRWGVASLQRRHHPRLDVSLPVEFVVRAAAPSGDGGSPADPRQAGLRTIGGGGLLLVLPEPLRVGAALGLTLYLPDPDPAGRLARGIKAEAVVAWTDIATEGVPDECRCGVAFTAIDDADRAAILDFIARSRKG